ncbi:MAG: hypothetical protein IJ730_05995 [Alphaproteobacteria bacterium]|nr:hypothetical protein [Alphaproteobacteria bacterium]
MKKIFIGCCLSICLLSSNLLNASESSSSSSPLFSFFPEITNDVVSPDMRKIAMDLSRRTYSLRRDTLSKLLPENELKKIPEDVTDIRIDDLRIKHLLKENLMCCEIPPFVNYEEKDILKVFAFPLKYPSSYIIKNSKEDILVDKKNFISYWGGEPEKDGEMIDGVFIGYENSSNGIFLPGLTKEIYPYGLINMLLLKKIEALQEYAINNINSFTNEVSRKFASLMFHIEKDENGQYQKEINELSDLVDNSVLYRKAYKDVMDEIRKKYGVINMSFGKISKGNQNKEDKFIIIDDDSTAKRHPYSFYLERDFVKNQGVGSIEVMFANNSFIVFLPDEMCTEQMAQYVLWNFQRTIIKEWDFNKVYCSFNRSFPYSKTVSDILKYNIHSNFEEVNSLMNSYTSINMLNHNSIELFYCYMSKIVNFAGLEITDHFISNYVDTVKKEKKMQEEQFVSKKLPECNLKKEREVEKEQTPNSQSLDGFYSDTEKQMKAFSKNKLRKKKTQNRLGQNGKHKKEEPKNNKKKKKLNHKNMVSNLNNQKTTKEVKVEEETQNIAVNIPQNESEKSVDIKRNEEIKVKESQVNNSKSVPSNKKPNNNKKRKNKGKQQVLSDLKNQVSENVHELKEKVEVESQITDIADINQKEQEENRDKKQERIQEKNESVSLLEKENRESIEVTMDDHKQESNINKKKEKENNKDHTSSSVAADLRIFNNTKKNNSNLKSQKVKNENNRFLYIPRGETNELQIKKDNEVVAVSSLNDSKKQAPLRILSRPRSDEQAKISNTQSQQQKQVQQKQNQQQISEIVKNENLLCDNVGKAQSNEILAPDFNKNHNLYERIKQERERESNLINTLNNLNNKLESVRKEQSQLKKMLEQLLNDKANRQQNSAEIGRSNALRSISNTPDYNADEKHLNTIYNPINPLMSEYVLTNRVSPPVNDQYFPFQKSPNMNSLSPLTPSSSTPIFQKKPTTTIRADAPVFIPAKEQNRRAVSSSNVSTNTVGAPVRTSSIPYVLPFSNFDNSLLSANKSPLVGSASNINENVSKNNLSLPPFLPFLERPLSSSNKNNESKLSKVSSSQLKVEEESDSDSKSEDDVSDDSSSLSSSSSLSDYSINNESLGTK